MKVLGTRVLVEINRMKKQGIAQNGIIIPDSIRFKPTEGIILAIGSGKPEDAKGNLLLQEVKVGDRVCLDPEMGSQHTGNDADGLKRRIYSIHDILAVLEPANAS